MMPRVFPVEIHEREATGQETVVSRKDAQRELVTLSSYELH
jgi:hypothetical protein